MAVDGTYDIELDTPLGRKKGTLVLGRASGDTLSGTLKALGKTQVLRGQLVSEGADGCACVRFTGSISVMFQKLDFTCKATIAADGSVAGVAEAQGGSLDLVGRRR